MVTEIAEAAPSWHISVARSAAGEYAAPAMPGGLVEVQVTNGALRMDKVGLPDGAAGLFDPGWDGSMGVRRGPDGMLMRFLASHGLGSPFLEDAKICAALGSYWPGSVS